MTGLKEANHLESPPLHRAYGNSSSMQSTIEIVQYFDRMSLFFFPLRSDTEVAAIVFAQMINEQ